MPLRSKPEAHHWRHAAEIVPLVAAAVFAAAALGRMLALPWWAVPVVMLTAAAGAVVATGAVTGSPVPVVFASAAGITVTGWSAYASLASPWSPAAVLGLLIPALFLGVLYPVILGHHHQALAEVRRQAEAAKLAAEARKWPELFARVGAKGITVADTAETRAGHIHRLVLPRTGKVTFARLEKLADPLETAARLRDGAIRFERGEHAGEALMHVGENDILAQLIPYPDDLSDLTVNRPFGTGLYEDGSECELLFREIVALIVGLRGSGKSNKINVLIAQLGRCVDTVIFMIDLKGGRAALPWIRPWLEGRAPRPVIDWVATSREEAERMLAALLRGIDARAHSGAGGEKVTPTAAQPAVVLIIDEMAVIFGAHGGPRSSVQGTTNSKLAGMGTQIVQLGRSEAVDAILATQRGTVTMTGGGDLKSQCKLRIGLGVATEADARLIIPDDASVARLLPKLKHPGSGLVSDDKRTAPVKFYRLENERITEIAEALGDRRPEPDAVLAAALGEDYAARWTMERAGHIPGFARAAQRGGRDGTAPGEDDYDRRFEEITAGLSGGEDDSGVHPARRRMLELLSRAGVMGMTPAAIGARLEAEGAGVARQTIQKWLAEELEGGRVVKATYGRWKAAR
jgi:S-DNA-T family DNA segregation ATPase FtsK/SpoIIIE